MSEAKKVTPPCDTCAHMKKRKGKPECELLTRDPFDHPLICWAYKKGN